MHRNILLTTAFFIPLLLSMPHPVQGQDAFVLLSDKNLRIRGNFGFTMLHATKKMKDHFTANSFADTSSHSPFDFYGFNDTLYPQGKGIPLFGELGLDYRLHKNGWLGISFGFDNAIEVSGFNFISSEETPFSGKANRGHTVTWGHRSKYLFIQYEYIIPNSSLSIHLGPTLDFHKIKVEDSLENSPWRKEIKAGAAGGVNIQIYRHLKLNFAFRWTPKFKFQERSREFEIFMEDDQIDTVTSTLPALDLSFSYFRIGLVGNLDFSTGR
jgi:hypothetical protein